MEEKDIDNLFRDAFEQAESNPPSDMWKRIEAELDKENNSIILSKKDKFSLFKYAAAAVLLLGVGVAVYVLNQEKARLTNNSNPKQTEKKEIASIPETTKKEIKVAQASTSEEQNIKPLKKVVAQAVPNKKELPAKQVSAQNAATRKTQDNVENVYTPEKTEEKSFQIATHDVNVPNKDISSQTPVRQVTDVEQLKPLIDPEEEVNNMYASQPVENNNTIVTNILNAISENIEISTKKDIRFRSDDEGSIRIDFINSLVKNRIKKRK
ncbi:hypothetical protein [Sphingobacterium lumbrici]|uniref:hypothetical protein n=1 Tax=Sphingobacterium lumbrici TaxID=2559600 RepID=UPI0011281357|nr:hypothetical protein [Sphingobacterium lumbrici]